MKIFAVGLCLFALSAPTTAGETTPIGDALLRVDFVRGTPGGGEVDRGYLRVRGGIRHVFTPSWEVAAALRASIGTDDNNESRVNLDNEKADALRPDRLEALWFGASGGELSIGKSRLLPSLGPMIWDRDLRPVGVAYAHTFDVRRFDTLTASLTWAHPDHDLERGSNSRVGIAQLDWRIRQGAPQSGSVTLSYAVFDELAGVLDSKLSRTNTLARTTEFELIDLQLGFRRVFAGVPLDVTLDTVRNLDAADDRDTGIELVVSLGDRRKPKGWEAGASTLRVQRNAVVAAFNEDDWWFPTAMRGTRVWLGHALPKEMWIRLAASTERRDDQADSLERILVDVGYEF